MLLRLILNAVDRDQLRAKASRCFTVRSADASHFLEAAPSFQSLFGAQSAAYAVLEKIRRGAESKDDVLRIGGFGMIGDH